MKIEHLFKFTVAPICKISILKCLERCFWHQGGYYSDSTLVSAPPQAFLNFLAMVYWLLEGRLLTTSRVDQLSPLWSRHLHVTWTSRGKSLMAGFSSYPTSNQTDGIQLPQDTREKKYICTRTRQRFITLQTTSRNSNIFLFLSSELLSLVELILLLLIISLLWYYYMLQNTHTKK